MRKTIKTAWQNKRSYHAKQAVLAGETSHLRGWNSQAYGAREWLSTGLFLALAIIQCNVLYALHHQHHLYHLILFNSRLIEVLYIQRSAVAHEKRYQSAWPAAVVYHTAIRGEVFGEKRMLRCYTGIRFHRIESNVFGCLAYSQYIHALVRNVSVMVQHLGRVVFVIMKSHHTQADGIAVGGIVLLEMGKRLCKFITLEICYEFSTMRWPSRSLVITVPKLQFAPVS